MIIVSMKEEAGTIFKGVIEGLASVVVPPKKDEKPSEYIALHWCDQCKSYHRAKK
jgi:hypothetical protein